MTPFELANPQTEAEALELLNEHGADTAVLAGGTDLVTLLRRELLAPRRVVNIKDVASMHGVHDAGDGLVVGALTTLEELAASPLLAEHDSLRHVVHGIRAIQVQSAGTVGGDLCLLPHCWYFRNGYGLLGMQKGQSLVEAGDNRYHAILGNEGPAKFVNASRFAPALIAWDARVRVIGPKPDQEAWLPLESFYVTPKKDNQGVTVLQPGQLISHVWLPKAGEYRSAAYEVLESEGLDWPLAAAAVRVDVYDGLVRDAKIVLGHVAPTPWVADAAAAAIVNHPLDEQTAEHAAEVALSRATPLTHNRYKVRLARTAVKRALLRAVDQLEEDV